MAPIGRWSQPLLKPRYPRHKVEMSKEDDLTFSLGRETNMEEVMSLLLDSKCIDLKDYHDHLRMVRINNRKMDNGQVIITCPHGQSDKWVNLLTKFEGKMLKKLHSYTHKEVQVKFSFIHPTVGVTYILNNVLKEYSVKEYWKDVDYKFRVHNGSYTFILYEEELKMKPLPESIFLNNAQCWISYITRAPTCHKCLQPGHIADDCEDEEEEGFPSLEEALSKSGGGSVFLSGILPKRSDFKIKTGPAAAVVINKRAEKTNVATAVGNSSAQASAPGATQLANGDSGSLSQEMGPPQAPASKDLPLSNASNKNKRDRPRSNSSMENDNKKHKDDYNGNRGERSALRNLLRARVDKGKDEKAKSDEDPDNVSYHDGGSDSESEKYEDLMEHSLFDGDGLETKGGDPVNPPETPPT